jgi:LPS-assembly protein
VTKLPFFAYSIFCGAAFFNAEVFSAPMNRDDNREEVPEKTVTNSPKEEAKENVSKFETDIIFYDADEIVLAKEDESIRANGSVIFLLGDLFLSCEKLYFSKLKRLLVAEGEVKVIHKNESLKAARVSFDLASKEARIESAELIIDPKFNLSRLNPGDVELSTAEEKFEESRAERIKDLQLKLENLKVEYANLKIKPNVLKSETDDVVQKYAKIVQRYTRTFLQPNEIFSKLSDSDRVKIQRRRSAAKVFLESKKQSAGGVSGALTTTAPGYLKLKAGVLYQSPLGNYEATKASVTGCRCEDNEPYAWGMSSRFILIEPENYVFLKGSTLEVLSTPFFYTPFFAFPIKTKRQSGLLIPSVYASQSGSVVSVPYFLALGETADATLTVNDYSKRGVRLDSEFRFKLLPENELYFNQEILNDRLYEKETKENKSWRWKNKFDFSMPLFTPEVVLKVDSEAVSDNRYASDFSKDPQVQTELFAKVQPIKRFYQQNIALEYFANSYSLAIGSKIQRDTFITDYKRTPSLLPEVRFFLNPRKFFISPLIFHHETVFQNISTFRNESFVDLPQSILVQNTEGSSTQKIEEPNSLRNNNEPFVKGQRLYNLSSVFLPLPLNNFVRSYLTSSVTTSHLWFPKSKNLDHQKGNQFYFRQQGRVEIPMVSILQLKESKEALTSQESSHFFMPFADMSYIPNIVRGGYFPNYNQLFFSQDAVVSEQTLTLGWEGRFEFSQKKYFEADRRLDRGLNLYQNKSLGLVDISVHPRFLEMKKKLNLGEKETLDDIKASTFSDFSNSYFISWAQEDLEFYSSKVKEIEYNKDILWPNSKVLSLQTEKNWQALSYNVYTTYNFLAQKSAKEYNLKLNPGEKKQRVKYWGDIIGSSSVSLQPFVDVSFGGSGRWNREWKRFSENTLSAGAGLPLGMRLDVYRTDIYSEDARVPEVAEGKYALVKEQLYGVNATWSLTPGIVLNYGKKLNLKPIRAINPDFEQSNIQKISFLGIQDCLDITLQRFKDFKDLEHLATWSVGLNLRFLGQERPIDNIAGSLDREIKDFYAKR